MRIKTKASLVLTVLLCFLFSGTAVAATVQYTYDSLNRLTRVERTDGSVVVYEYDDLGNRTSMLVTTNVDTDNDGLSDDLENTMCTDPFDADTDDDGISDGMEDANHNGVVDYGETNPCDIDTDDDGIQDGTELGYTLYDIGPDTDTDIFQPDLDPSTTTDPLDEDTDNDGLLDGEEDTNHNGRVDPGEMNPNIRDSRAMPWLQLLLFGD